MCLRWTLRQDILQIICKVDELQLPVYIHNNFGMEIARCSIPFPFPLCTAVYNNTIVQQNIITNETIVGVRGTIDRSINGNWSCRHGYGRNKYEAYIEINVLRLKEDTKEAGTDELRCLKEIAFYTMTGVVISVVTFGMCLFLKCKCRPTEKIRDHFHRIHLFLKEIDTCFESKRCKKYSVINIKIVFYISFVLLVLVSGVLIGVFEKDSCQGSFCFIILGIILCLTLLILFLRIKADTEGNGVGVLEANNSSNEESNVLVDAEANPFVTAEASGEVDEGNNTVVDEGASY